MAQRQVRNPVFDAEVDPAVQAHDAKENASFRAQLAQVARLREGDVGPTPVRPDRNRHCGRELAKKWKKKEKTQS